MRMIVEGTVRSDVGCVRETNEDSACLVGAEAPGDVEPGWLAVVADGMGGHSAGEVASRTAVDTISREYPWQPDDPGRALCETLREANRRVFAAASASDELAGMGTTCTAVVLTGWRAFLAHVGDSRLYLVRDGDIYCMTVDDSSVMEMVRQGLISRDEARTHADRNVILRALGTRPEIEPAGWQQPFPLRDGDRLVLCTDGLHDLVGDDEILVAVTSGGHRRACERLVEIARERGGTDNISAVVLEVSQDGGPPRTPRPTRTLEEPAR